MCHHFVKFVQSAPKTSKQRLKHIWSSGKQLENKPKYSKAEYWIFRIHCDSRLGWLLNNIQFKRCGISPSYFQNLFSPSFDIMSGCDGYVHRFTTIAAAVSLPSPARSLLGTMGWWLTKGSVGSVSRDCNNNATWCKATIRLWLRFAVRRLQRFARYFLRMVTYYCELCKILLNGRSQLLDHNIGKKHKKKVRGLGGQPVVHEYSRATRLL